MNVSTTALILIQLTGSITKERKHILTVNPLIIAIEKIVGSKSVIYLSMDSFYKNLC